MDFPSLDRAVSERTRGVVVVHPNNPTGSNVKGGEVGMLNSFCRAHGLALIADEVFLDYGLEQSSRELAPVPNSRSLHAPLDGNSPIQRLGRDDKAQEHGSFAGNQDVLT